MKSALEGPEPGPNHREAAAVELVVGSGYSSHMTFSGSQIVELPASLTGALRMLPLLHDT